MVIGGGMTVSTWSVMKAGRACSLIGRVPITSNDAFHNTSDCHATTLHELWDKYLTPPLWPRLQESNPKKLAGPPWHVHATWDAVQSLNCLQTRHLARYAIFWEISLDLHAEGSLSGQASAHLPKTQTYRVRHTAWRFHCSAWSKWVPILNYTLLKLRLLTKVRMGSYCAHHKPAASQPDGASVRSLPSASSSVVRLICRKWAVGRSNHTTISSILTILASGRSASGWNRHVQSLWTPTPRSLSPSPTVREIN